MEQLVKQAQEELEEGDDKAADDGRGDEVASRVGSTSGSGEAVLDEEASGGQHSGGGGSE